jgi:hypothetical protein
MLSDIITRLLTTDKHQMDEQIKDMLMFAVIKRIKLNFQIHRFEGIRIYFISVLNKIRFTF